jgi:tetratricopeptide (TPR) repeat protein
MQSPRDGVVAQGKRGAAYAIAFAIVLAAPGARAQKGSDVGKADALFNAGRSLLEAGEYADACPKFAESQKLAPGLGVTLYLADCYERLGRTASALVEFRRAIQVASSRGDRRAAIAAERAKALESRVPSLSIVVTPAARAQEVTVTLDGEVVPSSQWDAAFPKDPGDHELVVAAPSRVTRHSTVKLVAEKGVVTTTVDALDAPPAPLSELPPQVAVVMAEPPPTKRSNQKWYGIAIGGVGIVGLGVGSVLGALALSKLDQSNHGPCDATDHCSAQGLSLRQDAMHFGNLSTAAFVVGGLALGAGAVLFLTAPKSGAARVGLEIDPVVLPGGAGLGVRSRL